MPFVTRDFGPHSGKCVRALELDWSDLAHFAYWLLVLPASSCSYFAQGLGTSNAKLWV